MEKDPKKVLAEKIFIENAKKNMIKFDIELFRVRYRRLHKSIIESICQVLEEKKYSEKDMDDAYDKGIVDGRKLRGKP